MSFYYTVVHSLLSLPGLAEVIFYPYLSGCLFVRRITRKVIGGFFLQIWGKW